MSRRRTQGAVIRIVIERPLGVEAMPLDLLNFY